jgi:hypothetical protein
MKPVHLLEIKLNTNINMNSLIQKKMKIKKHIKVLALIYMTGIAHIGYTQAIYKIQDTEEVAMKLTGTSTLHDWEMDAKKATGEALEFPLLSGSSFCRSQHYGG